MQGPWGRNVGTLEEQPGGRLGCVQIIIKTLTLSEMGVPAGLSRGGTWSGLGRLVW